MVSLDVKATKSKMSVFHNNVLLGSAQPSGVTFDTTLIPNSIFFDGSGTSGDSMTRTSTTPDNRNRWLFGTWYHPLRAVDFVQRKNDYFCCRSVQTKLTAAAPF